MRRKTIRILGAATLIAAACWSYGLSTAKSADYRAPVQTYADA